VALDRSLFNASSSRGCSSASPAAVRTVGFWVFDVDAHKPVLDDVTWRFVGKTRTSPCVAEKVIEDKDVEDKGVEDNVYLLVYGLREGIDSEFRMLKR
jgi:hypothetical protein